MGMRVKLDSPSWFYSRHDSDWNMKLMFAHEMAEFSPEIQEGLLFGLIYNAKFIISRFLPRFLRGPFAIFCSKARAFLLDEGDAFVLVSQGDNPPTPKGGLVIWETYFVPPQDHELAKGFAPGGSNFWIRQLEQYGPRVAKIAVRGQYSANLLKSLYPQFSSKVVDLSFVHPEYADIPESLVIEKQRMSFVTILFVGRMARYKGLERLLKSLVNLRALGVDNFELVVVSDFIDGAIKIPSCDWIKIRGGLPHCEVMKLFAQAQIFVMPSLHESYGLVYLESMSSGCVTFVPDEPVQREFVADGDAGIVVDSFDIPKITGELRKVLEDPEKRVMLAKKGLHRYRTVYSQRVEREKWRTVFNAIGAKYDA